LKSGIPAHDVLGGVLVSTKQPHQLSKYDEAVFHKNASFEHDESTKKSVTRSFHEQRSRPCDFEAVLALKLSTLILQPVDFSKFEIAEEDKDEGELGKGLYLVPVELLNAFRPTRFNAVLDPKPWADGILLLPPMTIIRAYQLVSIAYVQSIESRASNNNVASSPRALVAAGGGGGSGGGGGGGNGHKKDKYENSLFAQNTVKHSFENQGRADSVLDMSETLKKMNFSLDAYNSNSDDDDDEEDEGDSPRDTRDKVGRKLSANKMSRVNSSSGGGGDDASESGSKSKKNRRRSSGNSLLFFRISSTGGGNGGSFDGGADQVDRTGGRPSLLTSVNSSASLVIRRSVDRVKRQQQQQQQQEAQRKAPPVRKTTLFGGGMVLSKIIDIEYPILLSEYISR
jgi:hypothetical protein